MNSFAITLVLLFIIAILIYVFLIWNFDYWTKRGIKTVKSYPIVGSFPSLFTQKRNVIYDIDEFYWQFKNTENFVGVMTCRMPHILILDPKLVRKIFVNDFSSFHDNEFSKFICPRVDLIMANILFTLTGDEWKERRAEITPGLTASKIMAAYPVTQEVCKKLVEYIKEQMKVSKNNGVDAKHISLCYTTEVVTDSVLGISALSFTDNPTPIMSNIRQVFNESTRFIIYSTVANIWTQLPNIYVEPFFNKKAQKFFFDLLETALEIRRKSEDINLKNRIDFLNYMLQLQDKKKLTTRDLCSHTMSFLTDGFETTALAMAHTLVLLARTPAAQEHLREEIGTEPLSFKAIHDLPYLAACIHEAIRIFPPLNIGRKIVTEPYELINKDGTRVQLEPGDVAIIPGYSLHHDPEFYDDPEEFKPERFLEGNNGGLKNYRNMGVYLGFGAGPRKCPGIRIAMTQIKTALVEIIRNFNLKAHPETRNDNYLDETNFLAAMKGGYWVEFEERHH